jgi:hypothetical protein
MREHRGSLVPLGVSWPSGRYVFHEAVPKTNRASLEEVVSRVALRRRGRVQLTPRAPSRRLVAGVSRRVRRSCCGAGPVQTQGVYRARDSVARPLTSGSGRSVGCELRPVRMSRWPCGGQPGYRERCLAARSHGRADRGQVALRGAPCRDARPSGHAARGDPPT